MRVSVDEALCVGHGQCAARAPQVFTLDDDGFAAVTSPDVQLELADQARSGAEACPERAISITD